MRSRRAKGPDYANGNIFEDCLFLLLRMLPNSIEKQRQRLHFFKFCLAKETSPIFEILFGGRDATYSRVLYQTNRNILQDCFFLLCEMLAISTEKQRKRPPFLKLCLADGWAEGGRPGPH